MKVYAWVRENRPEWLVPGTSLRWQRTAAHEVLRRRFCG